MVGPPLLLGQSVVLSESGMEVTGTDAVGYGISAIAERIFHVESPLTKQPLGDVDPIAIAFAPPSQLDRGNVLVLSQSQLANL
jgi:hypothetical protein